MADSSSDSIRYPSDVRRLPVAARTLEAAVRGADRLAGGAAGRSRPLARWLSAHHLWGRLQSGPPRRRPEGKLLVLSFDLDYQADTDALPALLGVLTRFEAPASLASIGRLVADDPEPYRSAVAAGHEIVNHTWSHPDNPVLNPDQEFWHLSQDAMTEEVARAQDAFDEHLGVRPTGFRTPHFKDAPRMVGALRRVPEITYASSALATTSPTGLPYFLTERPLLGDRSHLADPADPADATGLLMVPLTPCPEHRWAPFDTWHAIRRPSDPARGQGLHTLDEYLGLWQKMLRRAARDGFASVYFDPMDVMRDAETEAVFADLLAYAQSEGWTFVTLGDLARRWRALLSGEGSGDAPADYAASSAETALPRA